MIVLKDKEIYNVSAKTGVAYLHAISRLTFAQIWAAEEETYEALLEATAAPLLLPDKRKLFDQLLAQLLYLNKLQSEALHEDEQDNEFYLEDFLEQRLAP